VRDPHGFAGIMLVSWECSHIAHFVKVCIQSADSAALPIWAGAVCRHFFVYRYFNQRQKGAKWIRIYVIDCIAVIRKQNISNLKDAAIYLAVFLL